MTSSELKKLRRKQRKAELKAQAKVQEEKKENKPKANESDKKAAEEKEEELDPVKLVMTKEPLEEALKFLVPLQHLSRGSIDTHLMSYSIYCRKKKFLLMLRSLKRGLLVDADHPQMHENIVDFILTVQDATDEQLTGPVKLVVNESLPKLLGSKPSLDEFNRDYLTRHHDSILHLLTGATVLYRLHPESRDEAISLITNFSHLRQNLKVCLKVHTLLKSGTFGKCPDHLADFEAKSRELYPLATAFKLIQDEPSTTTTIPNHLDCQKKTENEAEKPVEDDPAGQTENSPPKPQEQLEHMEAVTDNIENN